MSMCSTFVQSKEGDWYKNPTVRGDGWFICWDDDEPIEIVADRSRHVSIPAVLAGLKGQGWELKTISKPHRGASRLFDDAFKPAEAQFLEQVSNGPTNKMLKGSEKCPREPSGDGVYFSNTPNGNGDV